MAKHCMLIGIGGGSGSGKTTLARRLQDSVPDGEVTLLELDSYYRDDPSVPTREREKVNFDHPDAIDWTLLLRDVRALRAGEPIEQPVYDYITHRRDESTVLVQPAPVVVVEGIHVLSHEALRDLLDIRIFVDTDPDIRFIRRLRRDLMHRDRTIDSVVNQYLETVKPMYTDFVEPSRRHADIVLPEGSETNSLGMDLLVEALVSRLEAFVAERA